MKRNHLTAAQAKQVYLDAFQPIPGITIKADGTTSGFIVTAKDAHEIIDRVLVRWDRCIFRNYKMVHDGRVDNG